MKEMCTVKEKGVRLGEQMASLKQFFAERGKSGITVEVEETCDSN